MIRLVLKLHFNQGDKSSNNHEIRKIFQKEKANYLLRKFPERISEIHSNPDADVRQWQVRVKMSKLEEKEGVLKGRRRSEMEAKLSSEVERKGTSEETALAYLVVKQIQFQINATMSMIRELDGMDQNQ